MGIVAPSRREVISHSFFKNTRQPISSPQGLLSYIIESRPRRNSRSSKSGFFSPRTNTSKAAKWKRDKYNSLEYRQIIFYEKEDMQAFILRASAEF